MRKQNTTARVRWLAAKSIGFPTILAFPRLTVVSEDGRWDASTRGGALRRVLEGLAADTRRAVVAVGTGYSWRTHGVLMGYSWGTPWGTHRGTHGVLMGHPWGTPRAAVCRDGGASLRREFVRERDGLRLVRSGGGFPLTHGVLPLSAAPTAACSHLALRPLRPIPT